VPFAHSIAQEPHTQRGECALQTRSAADAPCTHGVAVAPVIHTHSMSEWR